MQTRYDTRSYAVENQALLLDTTGPRRGTSPACFLKISSSGATMSSHARPRPGKVGVCFTVPVHSDWIAATVVGAELAGDGPYRMDLRFDAPLPDDLMSLVTLGGNDHNVAVR